MKVKNITIKIESLEESGKRFVEVYNKVSKGEKVEPQDILSFETEERMPQILTKERLRILKAVREKEPKTIYAFAKLLKRPYANVFNDVKKLTEMGLLELGKENGSVQPKAKYDRINITIPL